MKCPKCKSGKRTQHHKETCKSKFNLSRSEKIPPEVMEIIDLYGFCAVLGSPGQTWFRFTEEK